MWTERGINFPPWEDEHPCVPEGGLGRQGPRLELRCLILAWTNTAVLAPGCLPQEGEFEEGEEGNNRNSTLPWNKALTFGVTIFHLSLTLGSAQMHTIQANSTQEEMETGGEEDPGFGRSVIPRHPSKRCSHQR